MKTSSRFLLVSILLCFACSNKNELTLVKKGQTNYQIILEDEPDATLQKAAFELQTYLEKISSVKIPISNTSNITKEKKQLFVFTDTNLASPHTVSYKTENDNLLISGGSSESTLYAVYEFLEIELACKWFSPEVEKILESKNR